MKTTVKRTAILIFVLFGFTYFYPEETVVIHIIGDSTAADKAPDKAPETGWGTPFATFFNSSVTVKNHARNGRSTKSFREEGLWKTVKEELSPNDYVFIQFGHNDEVESKVGRYTTPKEFEENLSRYVKETRNQDAIPVLLTPITRRSFNNEGKVKETHPVYSDIVIKVASELKVVLFDLDQLSRNLLDGLGPDCSKLLYLHLSPGEHPNYPDGVEDNTHFSELGARKMAQLVLSEIKKSKLDISNYILNIKKQE